jgi:hypothetical protein
MQALPTNECPKCPTGTLSVYTTRVDAVTRVRVRYMKCTCCGHKPAPQIVDLEAAPIQNRGRVVMRRQLQQRLF